MSEKSHSAIGMHSAVPPSGRAGLQLRTHLLGRARRGVLLVLVLLAVGTVGTVIGRVLHMRDLRATTATQAQNFVTVTAVQRSKGGEHLALPGTLQGFIESPIYARTSGYVLRWNRDIGARVKKGELLAELDTPEIDQQLAQAEAASAQAQSSLALARSSAERWEGLRQRDAVSQQELDERRSADVQAQANLAAAEANRKRLAELEGFKHIAAPFDGMVTRRNVDVGDLVDAGNGGAARALFTMAQTDPLRVYVYAPQSYARLIRPGLEVAVTQAEIADRVFHGTISNTAGAIDTGTRTLQVEIRLPNTGGLLLPGAYVQVQLPVGDSNNLVAPSNSLMFRPEGSLVAVVGTDGHVHLQAVTLGRDFGQTIELLAGVREGDHVILNPADSLVEGDVVVVAPPAPARDKS